MILAVDVCYNDSDAVVAGVLFEEWTSGNSRADYISHVDEVQDYVPGQFYKRELPCILALIEEHHLQPYCIVIDGYVFLDGVNKPGLGYRLYEALDKRIAVIGVAKKPFAGIADDYAVLRGDSQKPLYVTATSDLSQAKKTIASMHGNHRIPTLLKRADQLCRQVI